jgi:hypothetical protein
LKIKKLLVACMLLLATGTSSAERTFSVIRGVVHEVSERPPTSGILRTFFGVLVSVDGKEAMEATLLIPYMGDSQDIPQVGARCEFVVHVERVSAWVGTRSREKQAVQIVDSFKCP